MMNFQCEASSPEPLPAPKEQTFKECTMNFQKECEKIGRRPILVRSICTKLGFKKRRFYDWINVLDAIGCCPKCDVDSFLWLGLDSAVCRIKEIATKQGVFDENVPLDAIINNSGCISISKVAIDFILFFLALEKQVLNIIDVSNYMSRYNKRDQTTRCKLYQAAAILENIGIISKTSEISEFKLDDKFFIRYSETVNSENSPVDFRNLLNHYDPTFTIPILNHRMKEFLNQKNKKKTKSQKKH